MTDADRVTNDALDQAASVLWAILQPYIEGRDPDDVVQIQPGDFEALLGLYGLMHDAARKGAP